MTNLITIFFIFSQIFTVPAIEYKCSNILILIMVEIIENCTKEIIMISQMKLQYRLSTNT